MIDGKRVISSYCPVEGDSVYHTWKQEKQDDGSWLVTVVCQSCGNKRTYIADHEYTEGSYDSILYNINNIVYNVKQHFCKCNIAEPMDLTIIGEAPLCPKCEKNNVKTYLVTELYPTTGKLKGYKCTWCDYSKVTGGSGGGSGGSDGGGGGSGGDSGGDSGEGDDEGTDNPEGGNFPPLPCATPNTTPIIITEGITSNSGGSSGGGDKPIPPIAITPSNVAGMSGYHHLILGCKDNSSDWYTFKERDLYVNYQAPIYPFGLSFFNEIEETKYPISICYIQEVVDGGSVTYQYSDILIFEQPPIIF